MPPFSHILVAVLRLYPILKLLSEIFDDFGDYRVLLAQDGEEALRIARLNNPDIILLDVQLPKVTGYDVCKLIKADPAMSHTKVIMLTGMAQDYHRQKAQDVGADRYIAKPFRLDALVKTVDELLAGN